MRVTVEDACDGIKLQGLPLQSKMIEENKVTTIHEYRCMMDTLSLGWVWVEVLVAA